MDRRHKRTVLANYGVAGMIMLASISMLIKGFASGEHSSIERYIWFMCALFTSIIGSTVAILSIHISALWRNMYWLLSVVKSEKSLQEKVEVQAENKNRWPWGSHHTEMLGHLEAAAQTFWVRYDPADPSTAPTNEMVSRWLRDERGVSREKANAIASILRVDGLRTGPR